MTLIILIALLALSPLQAIAQDLPFDPSVIIEGLGGLHPAVLPIFGVVWACMKVADMFIPESKKANWKPWGRKIWDALLLHLGHSRNAGSPDA